MTPTALTRALENNSRQAEQQLREAEQAMYAGTDQYARLEHLIASKLGEIASLQLENSPSQDQRVRQQLELREQAQTALRQELTQVEQLIASTLDKRQAVRQTLERLDHKAQDGLEQDPTLRPLLEQLEAAQHAEAQAHASYEEIRDECASKLLGYTANPIYRFLKDCHFGTEQYRPYPFQRFLDNFLARRVDFHANHTNEQTLLAMHERNESIRQTRTEARVQLQAQLEQQLEKARESVGMQALLSEEQVLANLLGESKARASSLNEQLAAFAQQRDPHLEQIRQSIAERLKARPLAELIVEAAKTPDTRDDVLVSELQLLHAHLREIQQTQNTLQSQAREQRRLYDRAKEIEYALRTEHYQDSCHEYQLARPIEQALADYMSGHLDRQGLEKLLDEGREYVPRRHRGYSPTRLDGFASTGGFAGGHSSINDSGTRPSSNGGGGGGGFRTTSSTGGGGFRTTDSF